MPEQAAQVNVVMSADSAAFESGINRGAKSLKNLRDESSKSEGGLKGLKKSFGEDSKLGLAFKTIAGAGAFAAIGYGVSLVANMTKQWAELANAEKTGAKYAGEVRDEFIKSIPIVGRLAEMADSLNEVFSRGATASKIAASIRGEQRAYELQKDNALSSRSLAAMSLTGPDRSVAEAQVRRDKELLASRKAQNEDPEAYHRDVGEEYANQRKLIQEHSEKEIADIRKQGQWDEVAATRQHEQTLSDIRAQAHLRWLSLEGKDDKAELMAIDQQYKAKIDAAKNARDKQLFLEADGAKRAKIIKRATEEIDALALDRDNAKDAATEQRRRASDAATRSAMNEEAQRQADFLKQKEDIEAEIADRQLRRQGKGLDADKAKVIREIADLKQQAIEGIDSGFDPSSSIRAIDTIANLHRLQAERMKDLEPNDFPLPAAVERRFDLTAPGQFDRGGDIPKQQLEQARKAAIALDEAVRYLSRVANNAIMVRDI